MFTSPLTCSTSGSGVCTSKVSATVLGNAKGIGAVASADARLSVSEALSSAAASNTSERRRLRPIPGIVVAWELASSFDVPDTQAATLAMGAVVLAGFLEAAGT